MFEPFSHYLAYGATDQQTARELLGSYDGLLVPGTVAAFQREGTGGFVLSLSATDAAPDYVIDPRFPLFQQPLIAPKKSHESLADLLDDKGLITATTPTPDQFGSARTDALARAWVAFNHGYSTQRRKKFDKYAERLGEDVAVVPERAKGPGEILSLYVTAGGLGDPWWAVSQRLTERCKTYDESVVPVLAAKETRFLDELLRASDAQQVAIWVSGLEELMLPADELASYGRAIRAAAARGQDAFALYGGFFHVLLGGVGLRGASHGIGYGEYRAWVELPQSGPPPARYYLRRVHRYVSQELAYQLYLRDRSLVECNCAECRGQPPIALDYHALMKHSVLARAEEIERWGQLQPEVAADLLETEFDAFGRAVEALRLPAFLSGQADRSYDHLIRWVEALRLV
jgi:hypothetical protein